MKLRISGVLAIAALRRCRPSRQRPKPRAKRLHHGIPVPTPCSVIDTATNTVIATIPVGVQPAGVAVSADGSKVYVANHRQAGTVSVIDTATNTVTATIPFGLTGPGPGGHPGRQQGLCHEPRQRRVGDRHGDQYGDRHDPRRRGPRQRRGGHPGRQQGLCRERQLQRRVGDRHGDQYGDRHDPRRRPAPGVAVTPDGSKVYVASSASAACR